MKISIISYTLIAWSLGFTLTALAEDKEPATRGTADFRAAELQITANLPASLQPLNSDDLAEMFAQHIAGALRSQGFTGQIHYVGPLDNRSKDQPLLAVNLLEWQVDRSGNVNCTFSATLKTSKGERELGMFTGTAIGMVPRPDWFLLDDQFEDASSQALKDLYSRMIQTHLLPP